MLISKLLEYNSVTVWSCITLLLLCYGVYNLRGYFRSVVLSLQLPGPTAVPFIGNCLMLKERGLLNRGGTALQLYGPIVRFWVLFFPFFVVLQPDDLQVILSSKKHTDKVFVYRFLHNFLGNGLITSNGERWNQHRKLLQPAFHLNLLENFINSFADASQLLCENLNTQQCNEINITKYINNCVFDVLNEAVLGVRVKKKNFIDIEQSPFQQCKIFAPERFMQPLLLLDSIYKMTKLGSEELNQNKRSNDFIRKMIKRRREIIASNYAGNDDERKCLLDFMIGISDNNPEFSEEDIVHEACTFMVAGQDSVATAVAFTMFLLAQNTDCQQKCYDELEEIFVDDTKRAPTMSDLREMRYVEMCIKETLRLYPSAPMIARKLGEEVRLSNNPTRTLPAGSNVCISPYATHRLPHIYPDPEKFDPERWSIENSEQRHPYAYIPFSAGPRYCIGNRFAILEMKTIVARLLRSFQLLPVPGKTTFQPTVRLVLRASGGLWVRLKPRLL